jgi:hypothetical protein
MSRGGRSEDMTICEPGLVEGVEGVEELLLDPLLVLEELDVVDEQQVVGAVALLEPLDPLVAQRVDEVVHERLAGDVRTERSPECSATYCAIACIRCVLPRPGAAVDEERVVRLRRRLGDRERGRVAKRFDDPITNRSNVYFGFIPASAAATGGLGFASAVGVGVSAGLRSVTVSATRRSWPVTSRTAAPIRPRKWPSIHSRVKSFGTPRRNVSSESSAPLGLGKPGAVRGLVEGPFEPTGNLVPKTLCGQLNWAIHAAVPLLSGLGKRRAYQRLRRPTMRGNWGRNTLELQGFSSLHMALHTCGGKRDCFVTFGGTSHNAELWITLCSNDPHLYWRDHRPFLGQFPPSSTS